MFAAYPKPGPVSELAGLIDRLLRQAPRSAKANELRHHISNQFMRTISHGGQRAAERTIAALRSRGYAFEPIQQPAPIRGWKHSVPEASGASRVLTVTTQATRHIRSSHAAYAIERPLRLTKSQREKQLLREVFYADYMRIGQRVYRARLAPRLSARDRTILLIGELEADVNNGGFDQYLGNKGRRRAGSALKALDAVGARATARLLASALEQPGNAEHLGLLDARFGKDDLPVLVMRHLG